MNLAIMKILPYLSRFKNRMFSKGIRLYHGRSFFRYAERHTDPSFFSDRLDTSLPCDKSLARMTQIVDAAIEEILDRKLYTPRHLLAIIDPYRFAPLTALLVFNTPEECRVRVTVCDNLGWRYESKEETRHRIPVMQLRAGKKNTLFLEIIQKSEILYTRTITLFTHPLPDMLSDMVKISKHTQKNKDPLIFVYGGDTKFPYAFDENGEIRYYLSTRPKAYGLFPLSGGRFLFLNRNICNPSFSNPHAVLAWEIDSMGRVYHEYYIPDGIHHDGCEKEDGGNIITISSSLSEYVEDAILEIDRTTGKIVKKLCLADILSDHPYFNYFDWAHINTVSYIPEDHAILICARNLHSVIKIDWTTDELLWILCDTAFWKHTPYEKMVLSPKEKMPFFYQAHAAYFLPERTTKGQRQLIIFDNHWHARRPVDSFDGDKFSHARLYEIDEENKSVRLLKDYRCPKTKIRSNTVCTENHIYAMCGFLNKKVENHAGVILTFDQRSPKKKAVNRYLTYNSFYRAYPFAPDGNYPSITADTARTSYLSTSSQDLAPCPAPDVSRSLPLPKEVTREKKEAPLRRGPDKFERIRAWHQGHDEPDYYQDLAKMQIRFYDELLLIGCRDHLLEHVYLVGKKGCFDRDYTDTEQRSPALFESSQYFLSIPTGELPTDQYEIYVQCRGELYHTDEQFTLS